VRVYSERNAVFRLSSKIILTPFSNKGNISECPEQGFVPFSLLYWLRIRRNNSREGGHAHLFGVSFCPTHKRITSWEFLCQCGPKTQRHSGLLATARDFDSVGYSALSVVHISQQIYAVAPGSCWRPPCSHIEARWLDQRIVRRPFLPAMSSPGERYQSSVEWPAQETPGKNFGHANRSSKATFTWRKSHRYIKKSLT